MKRAEKILELKNYLSGLYPQTGVFLHADTDFHFLIAVILSAQAMDRVVNAVVPGLFAAYPDIPSLAEAPYEDVLAKIRKNNTGTRFLYKGKSSRLFRASGTRRAECS
jgi:endonuclease-3